MANKDSQLIAPQSPEDRKKAVRSFVASSSLDGYEAEGLLSAKQLRQIETFEGDAEELRDQLIRGFQS